MSYVNPNNNQAPSNMAKRGGGGILFLIVIAAGVFFLMSSMNRGGAEGGADTSETDSGVKRGNVSGIESEPVGKKMPTTGGTGTAAGWDMEEVDKKTEFKNKSKPTKTQAKNGWEMEGVDKKDDSTGLRLSNEQKDKAKSSDWEMKGVEGSKKSGTKGKDDWEMEEVDK
jgi:hypothetical protein